MSRRYKRRNKPGRLYNYVCLKCRASACRPILCLGCHQFMEALFGPVPHRRDNQGWRMAARAVRDRGMFQMWEYAAQRHANRNPKYPRGRITRRQARELVKKDKRDAKLQPFRQAIIDAFVAEHQPRFHEIRWEDDQLLICRRNEFYGDFYADCRTTDKIYSPERDCEILRALEQQLRKIEQCPTTDALTNFSVTIVKQSSLSTSRPRAGCGIADLQTS